MERSIVARADVRYEDFRGHKLDRKLLALLQEFAWNGREHQVLALTTTKEVIRSQTDVEQLDLRESNMEALYAAKYNVYWYLSFAVPAVTMLFATFWHRKWLLVAGVLISLSVAVPLRMASVRVRWDRQNAIAETVEELFAVHAQEPPPMVEVAIIAPCQALLSTALWSAIGWIGWTWAKAVARKAPLHTRKPSGIMPPVASELVRLLGRYTPGILIFLVWLTYLSCVGWQRNNFATDDPMSDTGSALGYIMVVRQGFGLAAVATVILVCLWLACLSLSRSRHATSDG